MVFCNIKNIKVQENYSECHNPYFNRWFSAILEKIREKSYISVTILILIDGFLQFKRFECEKCCKIVTILILIDGFLQ